MKKLVVLVLGFAVFQVYGSTVMIVNSSNGSRDVYQLSDVQKMTFQSVAVGVRNGAGAGAANSFFVSKGAIRLSIGQRTQISVRLFSCNGQVYRVCPDRQCEPGSYLLPLEGNRALAGGVYILQVVMDGKVFSRKMMLGR